jgi:hypothetical protein
LTALTNYLSPRQLDTNNCTVVHVTYRLLIKQAKNVCRVTKLLKDFFILEAVAAEESHP